MHFESSNTEILPKNYVQQFDAAIFSHVHADVQSILQDTNKLQINRMSVCKSLPKQLFSTDLIPVYCSDTLDGSIIESTLRLGFFNIGFTMVFIDTPAPASKRPPVGAGGGGCIYSFQAPDTGEESVTKRIKISDKMKPKNVRSRLQEHLKLKDVLMEFAIYKIADLFQIGPKVVNFGFDLVCYNDMAEFYLEKCQSIRSIESYRLKYCVRVMHSLSFTHRDIKPSNLLFSKAKGKMVLTDFGLTIAIKQKIGEKTYSVFCGTKAFMGQEMKKIQKSGFGLIDLFINDLQSMNITIQKMKEQECCSDNQQRHDDFAVRSETESQQQFSTTDTYPSPQTPMEYYILHKLFTLYKRNECLDINEYGWMKFESSLSLEERTLLAKMISKDEKSKAKYLIYCYGYSSALLEKMKVVDLDQFNDLKEHFQEQSAQTHLKNDFNYKFKRILNAGERLKYAGGDKSQEEIEEDRVRCLTFYQKLQFLIINQFKTVTHSETMRIRELLEKMNKIKSLNSLDPIWDMAIVFVESCIKDASDQMREKSTKQIIAFLKDMVGQDPKQLFKHIIDTITLSHCSPSKEERVCLYFELVKIQGFLSPTQQLLNKSFLMKFNKSKSSVEYKNLKDQIAIQLKQLIIEQQSSSKQNQLLIECMAIYFYEQGEYSQALEQYHSLKKLRLLQYGMSKQISPILDSIVDCLFRLNKYKEMTNTYRQIRKAAGQVSEKDYEVIGQCHFVLGNFKRAKKYYRDCFSKTADQSGKYEYLIGRCWMEMMKWDQAIKSFQNSLISKDQINLSNLEYFEAEINIVECESYSLLDKPLSHFESKYYKIIDQISTVEPPLSEINKSTLLIKIYIRLQILYEKNEEDTKRKAILDLLSHQNFVYREKDLYERAGIYYCLRMIQKSFMYSYASGLKLKIDRELPDYLTNAIIERKEKISKALETENREFKTQFNCLRNKKPYNVPEKKEGIDRSVYCNIKLRSLLPILEPFYLKDRFQEMIQQGAQIYQELMAHTKLQKS